METLKVKLMQLSEVYPDFGIWASVPFSESSEWRLGRMVFENGGLIDDKECFGRLDILTDKMDAQVDAQDGDIEYQREVAAETLITEIESERTRDIIYRGFRDEDGVQVVIFRKGDTSRSADDIVALPLEPSLAIVNHSPTGFEWGYLGSGPAQLALALLLQVSEDAAIRYYQKFKEEVIATLDRHSWQITHTEIVNWVSVEFASTAPSH